MLLLVSVAALPPAGAAWFTVTVQILEALGPRLVGLQASALIVTAATRLIVALCELLPNVAVTVADCEVVKVPVVALNVAEVAPAATVTDAGTVKAALLLDSVTALPPAGAAWFSVTVQVLEALGPRLTGLQASAVTVLGAVKLIVALCELPRVAVTVADCEVVKVPAVALNVAEVAPAATVTDTGTVNAALLLVNVTALPPVGAAWFSVTVQVLEALGPRLVGLQASAVIVVGAVKLIVALCELLPRVAVTVAGCEVVKVPVVALNVAEVAPAATVTDAGTVTTVLLLVSATALPPAGAAWFSVTVQVLEALGPRLAGLQASAVTVVGAVRLIVALCELLPRVAVTVADCEVVKVPVVALNVAEVAPAATVTDAGTVTTVLLLVSATALPPVGAAWFSVTVQVLEALGPRLAGLQASAVTVVGAVKLIVALCELLPKVALTVADCAVVKVPVVALKVAEVAPAATVTDAGTVNAVLLLDNATALPPAGAAWFSVTVQVLEALGPTLAGLHAKPVTCTGDAPPVTVPPVADIVIPVPEGDDPILPLAPIAVLVAPVAIVRLTTATVPFGMIVAFMPEARHVYEPEPP
ncbi:MAG TPA: hypothetical protein VLY04_23945 [Bryobacteraceae bacterium]|nr:hypothetical protein [Bryobacteraceae bacterium]